MTEDEIRAMTRAAGLGEPREGTRWDMFGAEPIPASDWPPALRWPCSGPCPPPLTPDIWRTYAALAAFYPEIGLEFCEWRGQSEPSFNHRFYVGGVEYGPLWGYRAKALWAADGNLDNHASSAKQCAEMLPGNLLRAQSAHA